VLNFKPCLFAYPSPTKPPREGVTKVAAAMALLSTGTAKMMAREKREAAVEKDYPKSILH